MTKNIALLLLAESRPIYIVIVWKLEQLRIYTTRYIEFLNITRNVNP